MKIRSLLKVWMLAGTMGVISSSCGNNDNMDIEDHEMPTNQDVYAAGRENYVAKYWKNGTPVVLGNGSSASDAYGMVVSGNDIHVVGFNINSSGKYVATYWKNGIATNLTDGTRDAYANDIYLQGNDVYVAGEEMVSGGNTYVAKYWKNGVAVTLSNPAINAKAAGIAIYKNDVYVIGERNSSATSSPVACFWKNGQVTDLSDPSTYAADQSIAVSADDLVMMWSGSYNSSGQLKTQYAKNFSTPVPVQDGTPSFRGSSVAISGNDIIIAGTGLSANGNDLVAKYVKNGAPFSLMNVSGYSEGMSVCVLGSDIFVGGSQNTTSAAAKATYWKNGEAVALTNGSSDALIRKIVVVNK